MPAGAYERVFNCCLLTTIAAHALLLISCGSTMMGGGAAKTAPTSSDTAAAISVSATSLKFGNQPIAISSSPSALTLSNTGKSSLKISSVEISGTDAKSFSQTSACGASLAAGESCKIAILFTPAGSGARSATLTISDNTTNSPQTVSLAGTGLHNVILKWTPSPSSSIAGYLILRSSGISVTGTILFSEPIDSTTYVDTSVQAGQKYAYWITSVSSNGISVSPASSGVAVTIPSP